MEEPFLSIDRISRDGDLIEIRVRADTGSFRGDVTSYTTVGDLEVLTEHLHGFPRSISHAVRFQTLNVSGHARVDLVFRCYDSAGHMVARVQMREFGSTTHPSRFEQRADIVFSVEPTQVETFGNRLIGLSDEADGSVVLTGVSPHQ